ncbi:MAG: DNA-formamidopyrimidine glycosylase family protein [Cyclobacteriaceae bacterium]
MPELPDLQVFSSNLSKKLAGKKVQKLSVVNKKKLRTPEKELRKSLEGAKLSGVYRVGKELHFAFDNGNILGLHLMLRGGLHLFNKKNDAKFSIIEILFTDGTGLALSDFQGQATPTLNPVPKDGEDALSRKVGFKFLKEKLTRSKASVKNLLLDQKIIRGIGNAYADEILWQARISPFCMANKIPDTHLKSLAKAVRSVLRNAEKTIRKNHPDIISGEIRDFLAIHNAKRTHSPTGARIRIQITGGRKTYYSDEQLLF